MGKKYKQLTIEERSQIEILLKVGKKLKEIATILQRSQATISRELNRNQGQRGYRHHQAQRKADKRRFKGNPHKMTPEVKKHIDCKLIEKYSPEQITGSMQASLGVRVSIESIYKYIRTDKRQA